MVKYRELTKQEINILKENGCSADSWYNIKVVNNFTPNYIQALDSRLKLERGESFVQGD